uniref:Uncharacterized protein n=1 Tax=candidate division CPR3 bacterium TaxID=2268181 RepID=A0A7C4R2U6_UNCC3
MAIGDDFTIDYVNKRIYHSSGTTIYTVNALYSYLMDTFDELAQMDDPIPMSAQTPTEYTLINGWFMDDDSFKYLKSGAIKTDGYLNEIQILTLQSSGYTNAVSEDIGKTVKDDGADTGPLLAYNNTLRKWWVRYGSTIASGSAMTITSGTGAGTASANSTTGENLYANIYTLGSIEEDDNQQIYIEQDGARIFSGAEWWPESGSGTRHIDVLIKVREAGTEIDGAQITVFLRHYPSAGNADLYDHFGIDLSSGGRNAVPLATSPDLNNTSSHATVSGYSDVTIAFINGTINYSSISGAFTNLETVTGGTSGATALFVRQSSQSGSGTMTLANIVGSFQSGETITGGTSGKTATTSSTVTGAYYTGKAFTQGTEYNYSVIINCATRPLSEVYEYLKYVTRISSTFTMYPTATQQGGAVTWSTKEGQLYIRAHEDLQTSPTNIFSPVKASPFGTFAGGKFFGAQGIWVENMAASDVQSFQLIDTGGTTRTPPNQQTITIANLQSGDRVAVFRTTSGTTINKSMYTAASGNNSGNSTFVVNETISADTPASGSIRIVDTTDTSATREVRYTYTSWSSSTFSGLSPTLDRNYPETTTTAYVPYIDTTATGSSVSTTVIYVSDRSILVRVRRKTSPAILPFETTGTFASTGYSTTCIRTPDTIVT